MLKRVRFLVALAAVAAMAALAACGGERQSGDASGAWPAIERPFAPNETAIEGGSQAQRAALRELLERMGSTGIVRLVVERPNDEWKPQPDGSVMLSVTPADQHDSEAQWEAAVLAGAFDERSRADGLPQLVAYNGPDGGSRIAGLPGEEGEPTARGPAPDVEALRESVRDAVTAHGARVTGFRVAVLNARPVAALGLQIDRPAEFLLQRLPFVLAALPRALGGTYVEVRNDQQERVLASGWFDAGHVAGGLLWVKPQLDSCSPIAHSQPALAEPPPACPFDGARVIAGEGVLPTHEPAAIESIARLGADPAEKVYSLAVDTRAALCRDWDLDPCPGVGGRLTWLATIARPDGAGEPLPGSSRWLAIDDVNSRVVGEGTTPEG
jgi:hypothetical protein